MTERIPWIDSAKALGIFLVVLGHLSIPQPLLGAIYSFHMPLFFVLAGLTFNGDQPFFSFLKKKFHALIKPYFIFSAILFAFWILVGRHYGADAVNSQNVLISDVILQILYGIGSSDFPTPLWFLTCLFITEIIFYFILKQKSIFLRTLEILIVLACGLVYETFSASGLPRLFWNLDFALIYLAYIALGFALRHTRFFKTKAMSLWQTVSCVIITGLIFGISNFILGDNENLWWHSIVALMPAVSGSAVAILISRIIPTNRLMSFWGKNSLSIFALHLIALSILKGILVFVLRIDLIILSNNVLYNVILSLACLVALMPVVKCIKKIPRIFS